MPTCNHVTVITELYYCLQFVIITDEIRMLIILDKHAAIQQPYHCYWTVICYSVVSL